MLVFLMGTVSEEAICGVAVMAKDTEDRRIVVENGPSIRFKSSESVRVLFTVLFSTSIDMIERKKLHMPLTTARTVWCPTTIILKHFLLIARQDFALSSSMSLRIPPVAFAVPFFSLFVVFDSVLSMVIGVMLSTEVADTSAVNEIRSRSLESTNPTELMGFWLWS